MILRTFLGFAILAASPGAACAALLTGSSPGFHYFWKQGATIEDHDAAVVDCAVRLRAMLNGSDMTTAIAVGSGGGILPALVGAVIDNYEQRQGDAANMEGCMAIGGWSVVGIAGSEGEALATGDVPAAIRERLKPFVEAPAPLGPVLRGPFSNELAVGDFVVEKARDLEETSISYRAAEDQIKAAVSAAGKLKPKKPELPEGVKAPKRGKVVKLKDLAAADPERAYIAFRLIGQGWSMAKAISLTFRRLDAAGSEVVHDGAMTIVGIGSPATAKGGDGDQKYQDFVFAVAPGLWKFAGITKYQYAASLCFGAPAFNVAAGEVRFIGTMTNREEGGYPIAADEAVAREILAANPALAEKVKPAEWTNGFTSDCFGSYAYAYEIPGAPFVDKSALARTATQSQAPAAVPGDAPPAITSDVPASADAPSPDAPLPDAPTDTNPSESVADE